MNFERTQHRQKLNIQVIEKKKHYCTKLENIYSKLLTIINNFKSLDINDIAHYNNILTHTDNLYKLLYNNIHQTNTLDNNITYNNNIKYNDNIILEIESVINIIENIKDTTLTKKKELLNKIHMLKEDKKICLSQYKDSISTLENKLSLEQNIKTKELTRINNKHLQYITNYKNELSHTETEYIILSDEKYKKETEKLAIEQELNKYNNVKKLFRNTIINQINTHNTKKETLRNSIIDSKKLYDANIIAINNLQEYLKEYPLYKLNINLEYYKQLYTIYLIMINIIKFIKPLYNDINSVSTIEYINIINNLGKILCNKGYINIFNNLNAEYDYTKLSAIQNIEYDLYYKSINSNTITQTNITDCITYIIDTFSNIDINIFNTVSNLNDIVQYKSLLNDYNKKLTFTDNTIECITFTDNIKNINKLLIILEEKCNTLFEYDYNKTLESLTKERLKKIKQLNNLMSKTNQLSSRINNNNISIKELQFPKTFFVSDKQKIKVLKHQLKTIIDSINTYTNKMKILTDKMTNLHLLIESNIYNETLNNDFIRCNLRYNKIYDRTYIQKISLEEEYNNKLQTITENIYITQVELNNCILNDNILTFYNNIYGIKQELQYI
jgi:hypothetical protein